MARVGLTSRSLQEKSFFFFPGAQLSGLPAASMHRGNVSSCMCMFVCALVFIVKWGSNVLTEIFGKIFLVFLIWVISGLRVRCKGLIKFKMWVHFGV